MSVQPHQMRQAGGETELRLPSYMRQLSNTKEEALGFLLKAMEEKSLRCNFLLLYDMLTGERYFRIVADDKSEVLADLMLRLLPPAEWESHTPLLAMLSLMVSIHQARLDGQAGGKEAMEDMLNRMPRWSLHHSAELLLSHSIPPQQDLILQEVLVLIPLLPITKIPAIPSFCSFLRL